MITEHVELSRLLTEIDSQPDDLPDEAQVEDLCRILTQNKEIISQESLAWCLQYLSYFTINSLPWTTNEHLCHKCFSVISDFMTDDLLQVLIDRLRPMLLAIKNQKSSNSGRSRYTVGTGLKPKLGFGGEEDRIRDEWKRGGGLKSIPLFYVILSHLKSQNISSNLWWITPGILNLLDDTSDIIGVKLQGVALLKQFLETTVDLKDTSHFNFSQTGLFDAYQSILNSMCYYLPPSVDPKTTLTVWRAVYPTMLSLYRVQFHNEENIYCKHVKRFFSETILQIAIPRVSTDHVELTSFLLDLTIEILNLLKEQSVSHMQRIIYTLGEYLVRNPFITVFMPILHKTLSVLSTLASVCPKERVQAHKYDFLACAIILYEKCDQEGTLQNDTLSLLNNYIRLLERRQCDFTQDKLTLLEKRNLSKLFPSN